MADVDWIKIRNEFETTPATLKELAEKYSLAEGTVRSRKCREKWDKGGGPKATQPKKQPKKKKAPPKKKPATQRKEKQPKKAKKIIKGVVIENRDLTEKQRLFCLYFTKYWNATKAYLKAYGGSYNVANVEGPRLLVKPSVKAEIDRLKGLIASGIFLEAEAVLQKYIDIAFSDITDYVTFGQKEVKVMGPEGPIVLVGENGEERPLTTSDNFIDLKESREIDGTLITEISQSKDGVKVKLADRMKALEKLEKYFDLLPDLFKRRIDEERLKLEQAKVKAEEGIEKEIHVHTGIPGVDDG